MNSETVEGRRGRPARSAQAMGKAATLRTGQIGKVRRGPGRPRKIPADLLTVPSNMTSLHNPFGANNTPGTPRGEDVQPSNGPVLVRKALHTRYGSAVYDTWYLALPRRCKCHAVRGCISERNTHRRQIPIGCLAALIYSLYRARPCMNILPPFQQNFVSRLLMSSLCPKEVLTASPQ